jgi:hypothetical protein
VFVARQLLIMPMPMRACLGTVHVTELAGGMTVHPAAPPDHHQPPGQAACRCHLCEAVGYRRPGRRSA